MSIEDTFRATDRGAIIFFVHELGEILKITLFRFKERNKAKINDF